MARIPIDTAQSRLVEFIDRAKAGEEIVLTRDSIAVARIVPLGAAVGKRVWGAYRGKFTVPDSFFDPLPEDELSGWE